MVGKERLVVESDFARLPYVKACARETLRLHPVAPFNLPHVAIDDAIVSNYFIPKGSMTLDGWTPRGGASRARSPNDIDIVYHRESKCMGAQLGTAMPYMLVGRVLQAFEWSLPADETSIDLPEERISLYIAKPLMACAKTRLPDLLEFL
ncbi:hypothetical protein ZIOFF_054957 [Zingiber officinale]|uniref:Cytochrome P450 n=1 Tax=Zingiber officinale TaxID=94328 RepID=A0A8J5FF45_ZINOF|nr:hypothetical protein ZIOFF_054957 [Zingiber officinale]